MGWEDNMPWDNRGLMFLKEEFIQNVKKKTGTISQLCEKYNISRKTGHKWINRHSEEGFLGLNNRSKRPCSMPSRVSNDHVELIVSIRDQYPSWGAKKLKQVLINIGHKNLPSISSFNRILRREERVVRAESEKRHRYIRFERETPNELWQMDFKGHFAVSEGKCYPLTILDDCSRYSICLKACSSENEVSVRRGLEEAFRQYGLPEAMTMDNGSPWKGHSTQRLSRLTVWLMRLGIKIGHSRPYHPQTQGKDERFHRTFKEEVLKYHNFQGLSDAQKHFDEWRHLYNHIRPHEALGMRCPVQKYRQSERQFPEKLPTIEYQLEDVVKRVKRGGEIPFKGKYYYVGEHLRGEFVALRQRAERRWDIYYVTTRLGSFEEKM
jgi:transposase InsO family protein